MNAGKALRGNNRLKVHKLYKHADANTMKRKYPDEGYEDFYTSFKKTIIPSDRNLTEAEPGFTREESLQRRKVPPLLQ